MLRVLFTDTDAYCEKDRFAQACGLVDSERLAKINACKRTESKARSLCCGLLLQYALRRELSGKDRNPELCGAKEGGGSARPDRNPEIRYGYGAHGKPYFLDYPEFHFSLSHSGRYAALAFSDREVGIDIQQRRPLRAGIAPRVLSAEEYGRYVQLETEEARADWFFRCWSAKESCSKLAGDGLLQDFRHLTLAADGKRIIDAASPAGKAVPCREYMPAEGYYLNVCTAQDAGDETAGFPERAADVTQELLALSRKTAVFIS